jgi:hypothetical protein
MIIPRPYVIRVSGDNFYHTSECRTLDDVKPDGSFRFRHLRSVPLQYDSGSDLLDVKPAVERIICDHIPGTDCFVERLK